MPQLQSSSQYLQGYVCNDTTYADIKTLIFKYEYASILVCSHF